MEKTCKCLCGFSPKHFIRNVIDKCGIKVDKERKERDENKSTVIRLTNFNLFSFLVEIIDILGIFFTGIHSSWREMGRKTAQNDFLMKCQLPLLAILIYCHPKRRQLCLSTFHRSVFLVENAFEQQTFPSIDSCVSYRNKKWIIGCEKFIAKHFYHTKDEINLSHLELQFFSFFSSFLFVRFCFCFFFFACSHCIPFDVFRWGREECCVDGRSKEL